VFIENRGAQNRFIAETAVLTGQSRAGGSSGMLLCCRIAKSLGVGSEALSGPDDNLRRPQKSPVPLLIGERIGGGVYGGGVRPLCPW